MDGTHPEHFHEDIVAGIIGAVDLYLIAVVLLIFSFGIYELFISKIDVSTYQAVSGAGKSGMEELVKQMQDFFAFRLDETEIKAFAHQIALNVIPQIDVAMENGFTKEEMKMVNETQKLCIKTLKLQQLV